MSSKRFDPPLKNIFKLSWRILFVAAIQFPATSSAFTPNPPPTFRIHLENAKLVRIVDKKFLSVTIDSHQLALGWKSINLTNERVIALTRHLYPAFLRVGGTQADVIKFDPSAPPVSPQNIHSNMPVNSCEESARYRNFQPNEVVLVPAKDFITLGNFVSETELDLIYDLNVLIRSAGEDRWNSTNAQALMKFFVSQKVRVAGWELGNEPNHFRHVFNVTLESPKLAEDFLVLKNLTRQFPSFDKALIIGPDVTRPVDRPTLRYLRGFLRYGGGKAVDKVTFHQYYFDGRTATPQDFINTTIMNILHKEIRRTARSVKKFAPGKPLWLGETSSGWGGGCEDISDRFAASFLWLDKLGVAAQSGVEAVFKQTLIGGAYGLLRLPDASPTPDYFISILYKRLVGNRVLNNLLSVPMPAIYHDTVPAGCRLYFHCTSQVDGSITIFGMNVDDSDVLMEVVAKGGNVIQEYLLQAPDLTSRFLYLNGVRLTLGPNNTLPVMKPTIKISSFVIPKLSLGFWVIPNADIPSHACRESFGTTENSF